MAIEDWISINEASELTKQSEKTLRRRNPSTGGWLFFPELSRIQPAGRKGRIWFFRSEIESWIRRVEEDARRPTKTKVSYGIGENEAAMAELERMGGFKSAEILRQISCSIFEDAPMSRETSSRQGAAGKGDGERAVPLPVVIPGARNAKASDREWGEDS